MFRCEIKDAIERPADIAGQHSKAWCVDLQAMRANLAVSAGDDATVAAWVIEAPWAHPAWHSYCLILIHLRPMPDGRETKFHLAGASHEVMLYALDPDNNRNKLLGASDGALGDGFAGHFLTPVNFAAQFIVESDEVAIAKCRAAIDRVAAGALSPDTDYVRHWAHLFGDNMLKPGAGDTRIVFETASGEAVEVVIPAVPGPQDMH